MSKREVRVGALRTRRGLTPDQVQALSRRIRDNVVSLDEFRCAKVVASYVAKREEAQTAGILKSALESGKRVIVPRSDPSSVTLRFHEIKGFEELHPGTYGILEPPSNSRHVPLSSSDLVLVPVVAWDSRGNRMGYGKGYFDRALRSRGAAPCVGLAFEVQRQDEVPSTSADVPLDILVTEDRVIRFRGDGA